MTCYKVLLLITVSCFLGHSSNIAADTNVRRRVYSSPCERNICHENATCIHYTFMESEGYVCQCNEGFSGDGVDNCVLMDAPVLPPQLPPATQLAMDVTSIPNDSVTTHPADTVAPPFDLPLGSPSFLSPVAPAMIGFDTPGPAYTEAPVNHLQSKTIIKASHVFKGPIL
jgi:hypothetical protein